MPEDSRWTSLGSNVSRAGLEQVANQLLKHAAQRRIWLFYGDMGSGKTTLIKTIARHLGVNETMSSPTFSLVNEYTTDQGGAIYHIDLYRLKNEEELADIGLEEYMDSGAYCFIEWPDKLGRLAPAGSMQVSISYTDADHRAIAYHIA